ncbi:AMMECR1-domain-containing protein [Massarina eburnea CBS 473.64]|uniref:AMMECR1-domain-containing protein n=1 Tax=Massarina eburnea CBS 473.64 TaxID=1395130 RepID=A0A6A6S1M1_9PLEO|nr:AMMECR1-domain-containing protein [Massarina eburnea CBS 473.64]
MASQAHCAYCFEILSSSLEKRAPLDLRQVEQLWKQYTADPNATEIDPAEDPTELDENAAPPSVASPASPASPASNDPNYRPAAISRLLAPSPSSASSSSVQSTISTPSGASEASSATSKNSSTSSVFSSLGKKLRGAEKESSGEESPLFVTWNTVHRSGETRLRGCIGTFEAQELNDGLRSYALTSAFDDTRFNPISLRELPTLEVGVTLLTNFEPISDSLDWIIGTHGLRISFIYHNRRYGSTYLPDVAKEQGWTKEETMVSLMRKAGWSGRSSEWKTVDLNVVRYQGRQVKLGYDEWKEWREWVGELE